MRNRSRRPLRRLVQISLAAILGIVGLPIVSSGGNVANAVEVPQCAATANVFVGIANSDDFRLRKLNEPAGGYDDWSGDKSIASGWNIRFMAGPNGYVWSIHNNGELRRHRWNPQTEDWDDHGNHQLIATGWNGWDLPQYKWRVTVDADNNIFAAESSGDLVMYRYNETTKVLSRKVIGSGWDKYDQLFSAGAGVLYARDPNVSGGTLYRFHYDVASDTWLQRDKMVGWGWGGYQQLASPGGDIIYGKFPNGETWWYRYVPDQSHPEQGYFANNVYGNWKERVAGWTNVEQIAPAIDSCKTGTLATDVECKPSANIWASFTDNTMHLRPHTEAETGIRSFDADSVVPAGWNGYRFMAGANGWKYFIKPDGEFHRLRWNGTGWDNNGVSTRIDTNWGGWDLPQYHNRVTVDSNNHIYAALATGRLERSVYDEQAGTMTKEIIDDGWGKYDQVLAAGDGVLYARDPNVSGGTLYRFHYDWKNRRWIQYGQQIGWGWNGYEQILSPGGDIIYGRSGPDMYWYRWDNVKNDMALSSEGNWKEYLAWWPGTKEMMVDVDSCKVKSPEVVTPPTSVPAPQNERPQMIYNPTRTQFEVSYVDDAGTLFWGYQTVPGTENMAFQGLSSTGFTGRASLAQRDDKKTVVMGYGTNAQARAYTQLTPGDTKWNAPAGVNGALFSAPILVRGNDKLLTAFAVDGSNKLWYATQFTADGAFRSWRQATDTGDYAMTGDMTVVPAGDGFEIAYRDPQNAIAVKRFVNGVLQAKRTAPGVVGAGVPGAVVFSDGKVQLAVRGTDNKVYTQKEGA
ncbi:tachylectin-related carbohydrate-binding protein, partial [Lentzea terrae]|uniref:tachylectin-related carbohydrate-binding protein n=1 Tax=Lentzea terrae TaxID=2200761 RepID=UPI0022B83050